MGLDKAIPVWKAIRIVEPKIKEWISSPEWEAFCAEIEANRTTFDPNNPMTGLEHVKFDKGPTIVNFEDME